MKYIREFGLAALITATSIFLGCNNEQPQKKQNNNKISPVAVKPTPHADALKEIRPVVPSIRWRSVIELSIQDPELLAATEHFLNVLESHAFPYDEANPDNLKQITRKELSGQDFMKNLADTLKMYKDTKLMETLQSQGLMPNGKFMIEQNNDLFTGTKETGCYTAFVGLQGKTKFPVKIVLNQDYLKGAQYYDVNNVLHPVSVEGVLANEISHLAFGSEEIQSNMKEAIIVTAMGGAQRNNSERIEFIRGGNKGYVLIIPPRQGPATIPDSKLEQ